jgi:hypothetical protein
LVPHTCHQCGASVADDEQFCPECGAFQDPLSTPRPKSSDTVISVHSDGSYEEFELGAPPPPDPEPVREKKGQAKQPETVTCPSCGATNPGNNRHCQECGARLSQAALPTAPRPAVQATAGVRAALAISGLLFAVILVALLFNVFSGDEPTTSTTAAVGSTTQATTGETGPIEVISTECTPEGIGSFVCDNLVSGTSDEFQINWEDQLEKGEGLTIRLTFRTPMTVQEIRWTNIEDKTRFKQNYRVRGMVLTAQNNPSAYPKELEDLPGTQSFPFAAVNANYIDIEIESAWNAEVKDGNSFRELAIDEITVIGRPYTSS